MQQRILDALRSGAHQEALATAREFAGQSPEDPQAQRMLALALRAVGDGDGARAAIARAIALAPDDADLHFQHAGLLFGARDLGAAGQALSASIGINPNQFGAYILQAELALVQNDLDEAERLARLAARVAPDHPWMKGLQGSLALRRGDTDRAIALLAEASAQAPGDPQLRQALGFAYIAKGHYAFAEQALRGVLDAVPGARQLHAMVAWLKQRQGRPAEAVDELAPLIADPTTATPGLRRFAGELELAAGRPQRALPLLRDALAAAPEDSRILAAIIEAWRRGGDSEDARRTLDAALATSPGVDALWRARAGFAEDQEARGEVMARWRAARPQSLVPLEADMLLQAASGRVAEAGDVADRILELEPGHRNAEIYSMESSIIRDPVAAAARIEGQLATTDDFARKCALRTWLALAYDRSGEFAKAVATWTALQADLAQQRLALPVATATPPAWPPRADVAADAPPLAFLVGAPGSMVERVAQLLKHVVPAFRFDRFGSAPPGDALQKPDTMGRLAAGGLSAAALVEDWRAHLPARGVSSGPLIDWLLWWDNALAAVLRTELPHAVVLVALRDPRDMLLEWLAFLPPLPLHMESSRAAAAWLATALEQVADLHEQDLVPHRLLRLDDVVDDPGGLVRMVGEALGGSLPPPPPGALPPSPRFAPGHWRNYASVLADEFALLAPVARRLGYPES